MRDEVFLNPGEIRAGRGPGVIWTILGSCVSITLWHPVLKFGAMSHYLLPERPAAREAARRRLDARYGTESCELMLTALRRAGAQPAHCEARLFGGSHLLVRGTPHAEDIGHRNAAVAREFLERNEIPLLSESLFGSGHRRVHFDLGTGQVWQILDQGSRRQRESQAAGRPP